MILYHVISSYHFICAILHRLTYHPNDKAILLIPDFYANKNPDILNIKGVFFDDALFFPYLKINHNLKTLSQEVNSAWDKNIPYSLTDFDHRYVAGVQFYFTELLLQKHIHFECFEEAAGIFSRPNILKKNIGLKYPIQKKWAVDNQLINLKNPLIDKIYCHYKAQKAKFDFTKTVDFDPSFILENLPNAQREKILDYFIGKKRYNGNSNAVIVLTEQLSNLGKMNQNRQEKIYLHISDNLPKNLDVYIKPHPDDKTDYTKIFKNGIIIEENFPSELLPFIFKEKPKYVTTYSSTGIENLRKHFTVI